ncbi:5'-adenylylsulfate reductase-like 5 [Hibiscus syriacus]|uniref:5'-adenylylsulfate reductase-like 5 n=1 Tax=Hibiscus syriacus TaxID=106335 RepID=A0A6A3C8U1_HIBSY|nr:5'-adenylylsulfate reductase-like 5 [Hibiscus syriacus]KAE8725216.1 5'-adenylylsulfate reductase-like 5 [Hibiscus syriacus]
MLFLLYLFYNSNPKMGSCSSLFLLFYITAIYSISCAFGSPICSHESDVFIKNLSFQCSPTISPIPPLEVDSNFLARALTSKQRNGYASVLFYASWCPFSRSMRPKFDILSSMFPQLEHLAVEESSASPSIFSRYGIHSLPSILIVNQTSSIRYRGPKGLSSIVLFYEKTAGFEPVQYVSEDEPVASGDDSKYVIQLWNEAFSTEIVKRDPYLAFSVLFLCLRLLLSIFPKVLSRLKTIWVSYSLHLNLEIFGETSQLFARALHMVDVRRVWTKLRLCKARNFHQGAQSARVWASSMASVSLGRSSSGRSSSQS